MYCICLPGRAVRRRHCVGGQFWSAARRRYKKSGKNFLKDSPKNFILPSKFSDDFF